MAWQDQARALPFGRRLKVQHCGTDASAYISNGPQGVRLYCFRCGETDFQGHEGQSLKWLVERQKAGQEAQERQSYPDVLPIQDAPPAGLLWGLRAGLSPEVLAEYGFGWSEAMHRVVVPVLRRGVPTGGWSARAVLLGQSPKYIAGRGWAGSYTIQTGPHMVLVEDVLSCIKITRAGIPAAAALGTNISPGELLELEPGLRAVTVWTDPDKAGRVAAGKLRRTFAAAGIKARVVQSERDPKLHSTQQIKDTLCLIET